MTDSEWYHEVLLRIGGFPNSLQIVYIFGFLDFYFKVPLKNVFQRPEKVWALQRFLNLLRGKQSPTIQALCNHYRFR